ncbi:DUF4403 family protein [Salinimicrobium tongyeongense]|uniref:DUF4403 family protein n=1 Tax=Salinimicrobium tongyeongense TaxID=2809707 RepID=A0ABY6NTW9_9FLAO|nr:DUF4403 family protein [Salinimicrobium tongyeongense]UZH56229.1 DUF4403 family protein [Salinimicrobium tongyeongense]
MEGNNPDNKHNVILRLPVRIDYQVLEDYLQKKLQGKILSKGKAGGETSDHARIQKISLQKSHLEDFDLAVHVRLSLLTTFFRNKEISAVAHLAIAFHEAEQEVLIRRFKVEGENNGWFVNTLVEALINNFLYSKLKSKMKFDIRPVVEAQLEKINEKLANALEITDGVNLTGKINELRIQEIIAGQRKLLVSVSILGTNVLNIESINF